MSIAKLKLLFRIIKKNGGIKRSFLIFLRTDDLKLGRCLGSDKNCNCYFENKYYFFGKNRWLIYSDKYGYDYDASQIHTEWFRWIHHMTDIPPDEERNRVNYFWILPHEENMTGTEFEYVPYSTTKPKLYTWQPPKPIKKSDNTKPEGKPKVKPEELQDPPHKHPSQKLIKDQTPIEELKTVCNRGFELSPQGLKKSFCQEPERLIKDREGPIEELSKGLEEKPNKSPTNELKKGPKQECNNDPIKVLKKDSRQEPNKGPQELIKGSTQDPNKVCSQELNKDPTQEPNKGPSQKLNKGPTQGSNKGPSQEFNKRFSQELEALRQKTPCEDSYADPYGNPTKDSSENPKKDLCGNISKKPGKGQ